MPVQFYINLLVEFIALSSGIIRFRYLNKALRVLFCFICFAFFTELLLLVFMELTSADTRPAMHFYVPVEFLFISMMYLKLLEGYTNKWIIRSLIIIFIVFGVVNTIFIQGLHEYPHTRSISAIILVFFAIAYYSRIMTEAKVKKLYREPSVWINTAILVYFSGNLFFHALFTLILEFSKEFSKLAVFYFVVLNSLFYFLMAVGLWKTKSFAAKLPLKKKF